MSDSWVVNLSDGSTMVEQWVPGELSPWQKLMAYCRDHNAYVTNLRLTIGTETQATPSNAKGYWQAHGMPAVQGVECDEELHKWRGIGWVEDETVHIIWGARDPQGNHDIAWWHDSRSAKNQAQIIWSAPKFVLTPSELTTSALIPEKIKEYTDSIVGEAGGLKEQYVPEHTH